MLPHQLMSVLACGSSSTCCFLTQSLRRSAPWLGAVPHKQVVAQVTSNS